jgi:tetratricopeptide (TPR) repeat protein
MENIDKKSDMALTQNYLKVEPRQNVLNRVVYLYREKQFEKALQEGRILLEKFPLFTTTQNIVAAIYSELGRFPLAWNSCKKALILDPGAIENYNNTASILVNNDYTDSAFYFHNSALIINPNYKQSLYNLGNIAQGRGDVDKAIVYYNRALKIDSDYHLARYFLGIALSEKGNHHEAASIFDNFDFKDSKTRLVEELYYMGEEQRFISKYKQLSKLNITNSITGAVGCHAQITLKKNLPNTFCGDPLQFVHHSKFVHKKEDQLDLVSKTRQYLTLPHIQMRNQPLINNGWQTAGNFFAHRTPFAIEMKKRIFSKLLEYRRSFGESNEGFISQWPDKFFLKGWILGMTKGGFLTAHIHKDAWVSGSIYISVPEENTNNGGNLVLSLDGADYPKTDEGFLETVVRVETGDICIFPSSLFHYTKPVYSNEERLVLAFDVKIN